MLSAFRDHPDDFHLLRVGYAGTSESVEINPATRVVRVSCSPATQYTPVARLRVEQPAKPKGVGTYRPTAPLESERGAFVIPLKQATTWVELTDVARGAR